MSSSSRSSYTCALLVLSTAYVAELVAAAARHMIATLVLLHPKLAASVLFSADTSGPFDELVILRQLPVVNVIDFTLKLGLALLFLYFITRFFYMVDHVACKTPFDLAHLTVEIALALIDIVEHVSDALVCSAVLVRALFHVGVLIANLHPLEPYASIVLVLCQ